jgi:two-component system, OmpR family, KDP operon response regulator KdpE
VVLNVDDNADVRLAYRLLLETAEFRVLEAATAEAALECLGREGVGLLLVDIYLPDLEGHGLIHAIRSGRGNRPAIIAMSG